MKFFFERIFLFTHLFRLQIKIECWKKTVEYQLLICIIIETRILAKIKSQVIVLAASIVKT